MRIMALFAIVLGFLSSQSSFAQRIEDNSFLIEEAYNQKKDEYQYTLYYESLEDNANRGNVGIEFPLGDDQTHQLSFNLLFEKFAKPSTESGTGDLNMGYRYQVWDNEFVAFAPRASLLLPTGDYKKGFGAGATGVQFNAPASIKINDSFVAHVNAGYTFIPNTRNTVGDKADTHGANLGASLVYLFKDTLNFMVEYYGEYAEDVTGRDAVSGGASVFCNPGLRYAINGENSQTVLGAALINGVGPSAGITGLSFYLSFEH
jgi:hypothetical protein